MFINHLAKDLYLPNRGQWIICIHNDTNQCARIYSGSAYCLQAEIHTRGPWQCNENVKLHMIIHTVCWHGIVMAFGQWWGCVNRLKSNKETDTKDLFCYSIPVQSQKQFFSHNTKCKCIYILYVIMIKHLRIIRIYRKLPYITSQSSYYAYKKGQTMNPDFANLALFVLWIIQKSKKKKKG